MRNFINGFGTCFSIFTAIIFGFAVWWTQPQPIMSKQSNLKMDMFVMAYSGDEFDYPVSREKVVIEPLHVDMLQEVLK